MEKVKIVDYILERAEKHLQKEQEYIKAQLWKDADIEGAIVKELQYLASMVILKFR